MSQRALCWACEGLAMMSQNSVIVVIDDDASVRVGTENLLRSLCYTVHTFESAEEFLRSGVENDTSCVITDVRMPGMSGFELQTLLLARGQRVPFIFITAFSEEAVRGQSHGAEAICLLTKPFDGDTLIRCLDTALRRRSEQSRSQHRLQ
jgi:FixJ family two-component response regulator